VAAEVIGLNKDKLILMRDVQWPCHIWLHREVESSDTLYCWVCAIIGDGEELRATEALLWVATWGKDGLVVDGDLHRLAGGGEIELHFYEPFHPFHRKKILD